MPCVGTSARKRLSRSGSNECNRSVASRDWRKLPPHGDCHVAQGGTAHEVAGRRRAGDADSHDSHHTGMLMVRPTQDAGQHLGPGVVVVGGMAPPTRYLSGSAKPSSANREGPQWDLGRIQGHSKQPGFSPPLRYSVQPRLVKIRSAVPVPGRQRRRRISSRRGAPDAITRSRRHRGSWLNANTIEPDMRLSPNTAHRPADGCCGPATLFFSAADSNYIERVI
jgi:hypothetical protein